MAHYLARFDHPNIVQIYEIGEYKRQHYFSMRYVEGESLADRLKTNPLPPREAVRLIEQVARAIANAHGRGVIHCNLKPAIGWPIQRTHYAGFTIRSDGKETHKQYHDSG